MTDLSKFEISTISFLVGALLSSDSHSEYEDIKSQFHLTHIPLSESCKKVLTLLSHISKKASKNPNKSDRIRFIQNKAEKYLKSSKKVDQFTGNALLWGNKLSSYKKLISN
jgi:hypothetical protein